MTASPSDSATEATFAFVDLAGFTAITEAHGDAEAVAIVRAFRERALQVLGADDELVKTIGDAVMLRFPTPEAAMVALRKLLQRELAVGDAVLLRVPVPTTGEPWSWTATTTAPPSISPPASPERPAADNCSSPREPPSPPATWA